jgi:uncharacterized membrane protein
MTASTARIIFWLLIAANVIVVITAGHHPIQMVLIPAAAFFIGFAFGTRYGIDR